jgi:hypothetical protein
MAVAPSTLTVAVALAVALALFVTCNVYSVVRLGETVMRAPDTAVIAPGCTTPVPPLNTGVSVAFAPARIGLFVEDVKLVIEGGGTDGFEEELPPPPPQPNETSTPRAQKARTK